MKPQWLIKSNYTSLQPTASHPAPTSALCMREDPDGKNSSSLSLHSISRAMWEPAAQNSHSDGPHARATSSMWDAEGLVQIEVRDIRPKISRTAEPHLPPRERAKSKTARAWGSTPSKGHPWRLGTAFLLTERQILGGHGYRFPNSPALQSKSHIP